ncbi:MAG: hypothetical protein KDE27_05430 [Planctomycetes bacterium]|nr:hypothetical protein [Planctomycetota bacterium]
MARALRDLLGGIADGEILTKANVIASMAGTTLAAEADSDGGGDASKVLLGDGTFGSVPSHTHAYGDLSGVAASSHTHDLGDITNDETDSVWFADFIVAGASQNGWSSSTSGGSTGGHWDALIDTTDNGIGVIELKTGTGATGYYSLCTYNDKFYPGQAEFTFEARICPDVIADAIDDYNLYVGFGANVYSSASGTNEAGFVYRRSALGANWHAVTRAAGSETLTDTGVAVSAATLQKLKVTVDAAVSKFTFEIDGVAVATHTTNLPTGRMGLAVGIYKSAGTTQRELWVDWTRLRVNRGSAR